MINVCLVAPVPPPIGGIALWTSNIINYPQNDVNFIVVNTNVSKHPAKKRTLFDRTIVSGMKMLKIYKQLKRVIKTQKIDCVHVATSGSLGFIRDKLIAKLCDKYDVKLIIHLHFGRIPQIIEANNKETKLFYKISQMASNIVCMDSKTYMSISQLNNISNKLSYIPNPISYKCKYITQDKKEKKIIYVGWVIKTKGIEELIDAWNTVGNNHSDWSLEIVGAFSDDYMRQITQRINTSNLKFIGEIEHDNCLKKIEQASVLVLPSYTEGFPNVVLEAMMASTVVIATNVGEIPEILSNNSGIVINHHSVEDIISALEELINNQKKREELASNAYKRVNENYTIDRVFDMLLKEWGDNK